MVWQVAGQQVAQWIVGTALSQLFGGDRQRRPLNISQTFGPVVGQAFARIVRGGSAVPPSATSADTLRSIPQSQTPSPASQTPFPVLIGATYEQSRRRRRGSGPGYQPPWWKRRGKRFDPSAYPDQQTCYQAAQGDLEYQLCWEYWTGTQAPDPLEPARPETDVEFLRERMRQVKRNPITQAFVGPAPDVAVPVITRSVGVLARVLNPALWVFWPSSTAKDDTVPGPMPQPAPDTRGPKRRPQVRIPRMPVEPWYAPPQPKFPSDFERPRPETRPGTVERPQPTPQPAPQPMPRPAPLPKPTPKPVPTPRTPFDPLPLLLPFVLRPPRPAAPRQPFRQPGARPNPGAQPTPLTPFQLDPLGSFQPYPVNADPCAQQREKPRRKRKPRAVCYSGTFTETRSSTRKIRKRKIRCL